MLSKELLERAVAGMGEAANTELRFFEGLGKRLVGFEQEPVSESDLMEDYMRDPVTATRKIEQLYGGEEAAAYRGHMEGRVKRGRESAATPTFEGL